MLIIYSLQAQLFCLCTVLHNEKILKKDFKSRVGVAAYPDIATGNPSESHFTETFSHLNVHCVSFVTRILNLDRTVQHK